MSILNPTPIRPIRNYVFNTTNNNYEDIIRNMVFIDWLDIEWNVIYTTLDSLRIRNFDDQFENLSERQLNSFAFSDEASRCLNNNTQANDIDFYIPSCGCKVCNSYLKISLSNIHSFTSVKELLSSIKDEYAIRKINLEELCKNDVDLCIKSALNRLNDNQDVYLNEVMSGLVMFDNIIKHDGKYYLTLKYQSQN